MSESVCEERFVIALFLRLVVNLLKLSLRF